MRRSTALLVTVVLVSGCKPRICEPWKQLALPGVTSIEKCYASHIAGETTASADDFVRAFEARGFTALRGEGGGTYENAGSWLTFVKSDDPSMYKMPADFGSARPGKPDHFFFDAYPKREGGIPVATWKRFATIDADRAALRAKVAAATQLLAGAKAAPARCDDAVLARDPTLVAHKPDWLVTSDLRGLAGWPGEERPYASAADPAPGKAAGDGDLASRMVPDLAYERARLDEGSAVRMLRILRVTSYEAPHVKAQGSSVNIPGAGFELFTGGHATADVGVVDLVEQRVLCRAQVEAGSSDKVEVTRTLEGKLVGDPGATDLARNITAAAKGALARMSPLLK